MKSFLLLTLLLGVIFVRTASANGSDNEGPVFPNLICTLFTTQGCNAGCGIVAKIYGNESTGYCNDQNICVCDPSENLTLDDLWDRKFDSKVVLPQVKLDSELSKQVFEILKASFMSSEETKAALESVLPTEYQNIRIKTKVPSTKIVQPERKFNKEEAKKYTTLKLRSFINKEFPKDIDYKKSLNEALENAPDELAFQHLVHDVRRTHNPILGKVVDEFLQLSQEDEQPMDEKEEDLEEFVDNHIINELIKATRAKAKSPGTPPAANSKGPSKPGQKSIKPPISQNSGGPRPPQNPPLFSSVTVDYTLPKSTINKTVIDNFRNPVDKTWTGPNYDVRFKRVSPSGDTQLWWRKDNDEVYLHRHADGAVDQNWNFGGKVFIGLYRDIDRTQIQSWEFDKTRLDYDRSPNGTPHRVWYNNNRDEGAYKKYTEIIKSWCDANDFFVEKESCVIF
ncbi:uncharacterized protein LOC135843048 isoform X2 [Planococcus citri]|uniref:uncharacterized protein LOC135843048 isoform X2 n=1 Tax=Planococcus citri TaxID=170843 RepID=UPI0031F83300